MQVFLRITTLIKCVLFMFVVLEHCKVMAFPVQADLTSVDKRTSWTVAETFQNIEQDSNVTEEDIIITDCTFAEEGIELGAAVAGLVLALTELILILTCPCKRACPCAKDSGCRIRLLKKGNRDWAWAVYPPTEFDTSQSETQSSTEEEEQRDHSSQSIEEMTHAKGTDVREIYLKFKAVNRWKSYQQETTAESSA